MTDIVCKLTDGDARERLDQYARLFAAAFDGRERTASGMRWWLKAYPGIAERARDLVARENACCAFLRNTITETGGRVRWDMATIDDPAARAVVDWFYDLPVIGPNGTPCRVEPA
jgi:hypothetical protein